MKVQKLIDILKGKEIGGVTKEPREISLYVRNQDGSENGLCPRKARLLYRVVVMAF